MYGEELRELRVNRFKIVDKEFNIVLQAAEHLPELTTLYVGEGKASPSIKHTIPSCMHGRTGQLSEQRAFSK